MERPVVGNLKQHMELLIKIAGQNTIEHHAYGQWLELMRYVENLESRLGRASRILLGEA